MEKNKTLGNRRLLEDVQSGRHSYWLGVDEVAQELTTTELASQASQTALRVQADRTILSTAETPHTSE